MARRASNPLKDHQRATVLGGGGPPPSKTRAISPTTGGRAASRAVLQRTAGPPASGRHRLKIAAIGCGNRTKAYVELAAMMPERYEVTGAADPLAHRVEAVRALSRNPAFRGFGSDAAILAEECLADIMIVGTQDSDHYRHARRALEKGYHLLLEKPIATTIDETIALERLAKRLGRRVVVCHVMRYTPFYQKVKAIVDSGVLGDIVSLNATEGVNAFHQAHSFVRGYWSVVKECSPMIVAKSCHDLDLISWIVGRACLRVSSFGALTHFTKAHAPQGAPRRCTDGCAAADTCIYNALHYAGRERHRLGGIFDGEAGATREQIFAWLKQSPWGRCVYRCDNTAVDHQTVNMDFEGGSTGTFTMTAFASSRHIEIFGTKAVLRGGGFVKEATGSDIVVTDHVTLNQARYRVAHEVGGYVEHGGGDPALMLALHAELTGKNTAEMHTSISRSVESHLIAFAAEESRLSGRTVDLRAYYTRHARRAEALVSE